MPDKIVSIKVNRSFLPKGKYHEVGFESRQVIQLKISRIITEYRTQILEDKHGNRYIAEFPEGVTRPIQYGQSVKAHAVYLSLFQLISYERVADYFCNEIKIPISVGSLFNFNQEAYKRLEEFDMIAKERLIDSPLLHADETGINVNGKRLWLHTACNDLWTYFSPHEKRGNEAMNAIEILPKFKGRLVHDHWKPYFGYQCLHVLCNAHHIRELQWVTDNHNYVWPKKMQDLLIETNEAVKASDLKKLEVEAAENICLRYREILDQGKEEMLATLPVLVLQDGVSKKKRGRKKRSKEMNLLERLRDYEDEALRFMEETIVPFSNNRGENDIRMTKVQQKISGCFRSMDGAKIFCRVRSYLLTAQKYGIPPTDALKILFNGKLPDIFYTGKGCDLVQAA